MPPSNAQTRTVSVEEARNAIALNQLYRLVFFRDLVAKTNNFGNVKWLGLPVWQNILDLWIIQETIAEVRPGLLIECGTNRGGSALFYAHLFDLLGSGSVISVDVTAMHSLTHPRVQFLIGSSVDQSIAKGIHEAAAASPGPIMVILDSDHAAAHVLQEMDLYGPLVTAGSYMLVQDGVMDVLEMLRGPGPGPLVAIQQFLQVHSEFEVDQERCERFLISHHPSGWLRRRRGAGAG